MSPVELVIGCVALGALATFVLTLRWMRQATRQSVPVATVVDGDERWLEGRGRQRLIARANHLGPVAFAVAMTSIAIMLACLVAILGVVLVAAA
jgi:hypothetical protein